MSDSFFILRRSLLAERTSTLLDGGDIGRYWREACDTGMRDVGWRVDYEDVEDRDGIWSINVCGL
jgi:hypothetical protein